MSVDLTVGELLRAAVRFLDGDRSSTPDAAFAAALLTREALEDAFARWSRRVLGLDLRGVSGRARLAVVEAHLSDREMALSARYAWHELSATLHHGPVLTDPAAVRRLTVSVVDVARLLEEEMRRAAATRQNAPATTSGAA